MPQGLDFPADSVVVVDRGYLDYALYSRWAALIAILLLKYLQLRSRLGWSLSNLVALLRWNLFTYRDLWAWLDEPFDTPPIVPLPEQLILELN